MPFDRRAPLNVHAEAMDKGQTAWGWAVYRGSERFLILRSRPDYPDRSDALAAGFEAAKDIGRRLGVEVVSDDAALPVRELA